MRLRAVLVLIACAEKPSARTRHAEMLRLCARIGYSPPAA
jgi:hypothetical protein